MAKSGDNTAVVQAIDAAAAKYGLDPTTLLTIAYIETGGSYDPLSKNPKSSAKGLFQFINTTGKDYGLTGKDAYDVNQAADAAARLTVDNMEALRKALGREPTIGELYLAHQQGAQGAATILSSPSGTNAVTTLGYDKVALNVPRLQGESATEFTNRVSRMTMGDFSNIWLNKAETVASTRLPPGYVPSVGSLRDTARMDTGAYMGLPPSAAASGFFGVDPRPSPRNTQALANARSSNVARTISDSAKLPVDTRDMSRSNTPVPVPRPTFVPQPAGTRAAVPVNRTAPDGVLPDPLKLMQAYSPATKNSSGQNISQRNLQAIQATNGAARPSGPALVPAARTPQQVNSLYAGIYPTGANVGNTTYVRPDGTSRPATVMSGSPTAPPSPGYMPRPATAKPTSAQMNAIRELPKVSGGSPYMTASERVKFAMTYPNMVGATAPKPTVAAPKPVSAPQYRLVSKSVDNPAYTAWVKKYGDGSPITTNSSGQYITQNQLAAIQSATGAPRPAVAAPPPAPPKMITVEQRVPINITVNGGNNSGGGTARPPANTFKGSATGNTYTEGQQYRNSRGEVVTATANGFVDKGGKSTSGSYSGGMNAQENLKAKQAAFKASFYGDRRR